MSLKREVGRCILSNTSVGLRHIDRKVDFYYFMLWITISALTPVFFPSSCFSLSSFYWIKSNIYELLWTGRWSTSPAAAARSWSACVVEFQSTLARVTVTNYGMALRDRLWSIIQRGQLRFPTGWLGPHANLEFWTRKFTFHQLCLCTAAGLRRAKKASNPTASSLLQNREWCTFCAVTITIID